MPGPWVLAKCCNSVIRSEHRHDFRRCRCGKVSVDGGSSYLRMGFPEGNPNDWYEFVGDDDALAKHRVRNVVPSGDLHFDD